MKNYLNFIREFIDVDPYGEEDWKDEGINTGDKVIFIGGEDSMGELVHAGKYEIRRIIPMNGYNMYALKGFRDFTWNEKLFKKANESFDIDPYNEENWGEEDFVEGDKVLCKKDIMSSNDKYWLFHKDFQYKIIKIVKHTRYGKLFYVKNSQNSGQPFVENQFNRHFTKIKN
jgi:hypothetical protein